MTIITRYVVREFLKLFLLCLSTCIVLFFVIDLSMQYLGNLDKYNAPFSLTLLLCLYKLPQMLYWLSPMAILLAIFSTLALFSRNNEIIAIKASGISVYAIIAPLVIVSLCVTILSFGNQELVLPYASQRAEYIENIRIKQKEGRKLLKQNRFCYRSEDAICNIDLFEHKTNTLHGITIYYFDKTFSLVKRVDALVGKWQDNQWHFFNVVTRTFAPDGSIDIEMAQEAVISLKETPEDFKVAVREPEEMSYAELKDYIAKLERAGYTVPEYVPYLYAKISFPFTCLIMPLLAIPFALRIGKGGSIAFGIGLSVIIGFVYFAFFNFGLSLGKGGLLPPVLSAWAANIFFGTFGAYLFLRVRQ